jgi:hypothetical protein
MVFSKVGPNQSIEWGQIRVSKSKSFLFMDYPETEQGFTGYTRSWVTIRAKRGRPQPHVNGLRNGTEVKGSFMT